MQCGMACRRCRSNTWIQAGCKIDGKAHIASTILPIPHGATNTALAKPAHCETATLSGEHVA
jgi:hypothetical protein